jgi:hypothetical protein
LAGQQQQQNTGPWAVAGYCLKEEPTGLADVEGGTAEGINLETDDSRMVPMFLA